MIKEIYTRALMDSKGIPEEAIEKALSSNTIHKEISKIEKEIQGLENIIDKETYEDKYNLLMEEINEKVQTKEKSLSNLEEEKDIKKCLLAFKKVLE